MTLRYEGTFYSKISYTFPKNFFFQTEKIFLGLFERMNPLALPKAFYTCCLDILRFILLIKDNSIFVNHWQWYWIRHYVFDWFISVIIIRVFWLFYCHEISIYTHEKVRTLYFTWVFHKAILFFMLANIS